MRLHKAFYRVGLCAALSAGPALVGAAEAAYPAADFKPSIIVAAAEVAKPAAEPLLLAAATTPALESPEAKSQAAAKPTAKPAKGKLLARSTPAAEKKESGPGVGDFLFLILAVGALLLVVTGNSLKSLLCSISALLSKLATVAGKPSASASAQSAPAKAEEIAAKAEEECTGKAYGYAEEVKIYGYAEVVEPPPAPVIYGYAGNEADEDVVPAPVEAAAPVAEAAAPVVEASTPAEEPAAPIEVAAAPAKESAPVEAVAEPVEAAAAVEAAAPAEEPAAAPAAKPKRTTTRRAAAPRKRSK